MNKHLKIAIALLASIFGLAACGQKNSADSAAQTSQTVQTTTTAPITQANNKQSDHQSSDNKVTRTLTHKIAVTFQKTVKLHTKLITQVVQQHSNTSSRMTSSISKLGFTLMTLKD